MQTSENGNSSFVTDDNEGVHNMMTKAIIYRRPSGGGFPFHSPLMFSFKDNFFRYWYISNKA
ncbi:hypothetical protein C5167_040740 [Papaver somniferum]|uniref:Uncharacterized protein n=1 Tax=Papaver somniferum TaxID=3469 RepID=A0A4Y7II80_PAPSO|nr:hypothetical protein C5167_040740 [Papaver somniferum]